MGQFKATDVGQKTSLFTVIQPVLVSLACYSTDKTKTTCLVGKDAYNLGSPFSAEVLLEGFLSIEWE